MEIINKNKYFTEKAMIEKYKNKIDIQKIDGKDYQISFETIWKFYNCSEEEKQKIIMNILEDNNCFVKMNIEDAYSILRDLNIKEEEIKETYISLMSNNLKKILEK